MSDDLREWLERLYGKSPGYIAITAFSGGKPRKTKWVNTSELDAARKTITLNVKKDDVYLSVGTHLEPQETGKGGENSIISIPGFWADLDIGELGHKPASLPNPPNESSALSIIDGLPEPSMMMHTGGGLQGLWLFEEPWVFDTSEDKTHAKQASIEWQNLLEEKGKVLGYHVDKIPNLDRILRVPESFNHKTGSLRPVSIRWVNKASHNIEDLTSLGVPDSYEIKSPEPFHDDFPLSWNEILAPHGYTQCSETTWTRPGKNCSEGISLSIPDFATYVITNFSSSDDKLPAGAGKKLTKLRLYALLNFKGDINKAQKSLPKRKLKLTPASSITPKPVHWLWKDRIALGTLALLAGREGIGKSTVGYTLVANITKGNLEGWYENTPRNVIIVATEDSWEFTIVPRLMAAKADLNKVFRVEPTDPDEYGISLPRDIEELSLIVKESGTALILLDPLMSRVDTKLDTHKDSEVRKALEPLVKMADQSGASVLGLIHVNKGGSTDPLSTLMGSRAFSAVARAVLYVVEDPEDREIKILGQPKNNLGRSDLSELSYTLTQVTVGEWEGEIITSVALKWGKEQVPGRIRNILSVKSTQKSKIDLAAEWLEEFLAEHGKSSSQIVKEAGKELGFSETTIKRAFVEIGGISDREGFPANTYWKLANIDPETVTNPWNISEEE